MNLHPGDNRTTDGHSRLALLLEKVPAGLRGALLMSVVSFRPNMTLETSFAIGEFRSAFAAYWESRFNGPVPLTALRSSLDEPIPIRTVIEFNRFAFTRNAADIDAYLGTLVQHLADRIRACDGTKQRTLFATSSHVERHQF